MKKLLILGTLLALVALVALPMAAFAADPDAGVSGTVVAATIEVNAPADIAFGNFVFGDNSLQSGTDGTVTITPGSQNPTGWVVTAVDNSNGGYMRIGGGTWLSNKMQICIDGVNYWNCDLAGITRTGGGLSGSIPFWAKQNITNADTPGAYTITITFTGSITF